MKSLRKPKESSAKVARDRLHYIVHEDRAKEYRVNPVFVHVGSECWLGATMVIGKPYKYYRKGE